MPNKLPTQAAIQQISPAQISTDPKEVSISGDFEPVEALRQAQNGRFVCYGAGSIDVLKGIFHSSGVATHGQTSRPSQRIYAGQLQQKTKSKWSATGGYRSHHNNGNVGRAFSGFVSRRLENVAVDISAHGTNHAGSGQS